MNGLALVMCIGKGKEMVAGQLMPLGDEGNVEESRSRTIKKKFGLNMYMRPHLALNVAHSFIPSLIL